MRLSLSVCGSGHLLPLAVHGCLLRKRAADLSALSYLQHVVATADALVRWVGKTCCELPNPMAFGTCMADEKQNEHTILPAVVIYYMPSANTNSCLVCRATQLAFLSLSQPLSPDQGPGSCWTIYWTAITWTLLAQRLSRQSC